MLFPLSRRARERYGLEEFSASAPELRVLRAVALRLNEGRDLVRYPEQAVRAGELNALALLTLSLRRLLRRAGGNGETSILDAALGWLEDRFGPERLDRALARFEALFGAPAAGQQDPAAVVGEALSGRPPEGRSALLEEMLLLWLTTRNPAAEPLAELFDDCELEAETGYREMVEALGGFLDEVPEAAGRPGLMTELLAPARRAPDSLRAQLELVLGGQGETAPGDSLRPRIERGLDVLREEEKPVFFGPPGPGPARVLDYAELEDEAARFSLDEAWMPELVLVAKNTLVWLDQLSRSYDRPVRRLDEIPGEELDRLARMGFSGLWLIGLWRRSEASRRIKQLAGNPDAVASAYAVDDYEIAEELGGAAALEDLKDRSLRRGLRLACDMVPNHMGIDSRWVVEHPERFLSVAESPFPGYSFPGEDLCRDRRVGVYLEDGYADRSDAAVVFLRIDRATGARRYLYHGNDGTSLPWNDTAQLDVLNPETREAIIQAVLKVAKRFPVIRFDAAMTLARRHVRRLWHPLPGEGGAIPSRSEHSLAAEDFDRAMPEELWREVVDRVAAEAPGTLLLAEAFWLMEGYFVRSLGMHRVYNSAFMHMMRDEQNAKLRESLKKTLALDPEILRRFVNYVTNPDEAPAAEQLGTGDKYFAVCTLMVTLPGLPLFGHGQLEGFKERYGMEFRRAARAEEADAVLVARHERQIVPLLERRAVFAGVERFRLYDFERPAEEGGGVVEDVYALSNALRRPDVPDAEGAGEGENTGDGAEAWDRTVVLVHNRAEAVRGRVRLSVSWRRSAAATPKPTSKAEAEADTAGPPELLRETLGEALGVAPRGGRFVLFRDAVSGLEHLRSARELATRGLEAELSPYACQVLLDFRQEEESEDRPWGKLAERLGTRGVPSLERALRGLRAEPVQAPLRRILEGEEIGRLAASDGDSGKGAVLDADRDALVEGLLARARTHLPVLLRALGKVGSEEPEVRPGKPADLVVAMGRCLDAALGVLEAGDIGGEGELAEAEAGEAAPDSRRPAFLVWALLRPLGWSRELMEEHLLADSVEEVLAGRGVGDAARAAAAVRLFAGWPGWPVEPPPETAELLEAWLKDEELRRFLEVHRFDGVVWFRKEAFKDFLWWLEATAAVEPEGGRRDLAKALAAELRTAMEASGYRLVDLVENLRATADGS